MTAALRTNSDRRESSDCYAFEIYRSGGGRVIESACRWQWILQPQTRAGCPAVPRWKAVYYCRTLAALLRLWATSTREDRAILMALLPERLRK